MGLVNLRIQHPILGDEHSDVVGNARVTFYHSGVKVFVWNTKHSPITIYASTWFFLGSIVFFRVHMLSMGIPAEA